MMSVSEFGVEETKELVQDDKIAHNSILSRLVYAYEKTKGFHSFILIVFCLIPFSLLAFMETPYQSSSNELLTLPRASHNERCRDVCENPFNSYIDYYVFEEKNLSSCVLLTEETKAQSSKLSKELKGNSWRNLKAFMKSTLKASTSFILYLIVPVFSIYQFFQLLVNVAQILKEL